MFEAEYVPQQKPLFKVRLCINKRLNTDDVPSCAARGSRELADKLERLILENSIPAELVRSPCMNNCRIGPNLKIQGAELYNEVSDEKLADIVAAIKAEAERRQAEAANAS
jgi:NADH:ubiquinone oxidoreductase subunit E